MDKKQSHSTEIMIQEENNHEQTLEGLTENIHKKIEGAKNTESYFSTACIYRVPEELRKLKESAYTPRLIAIGPLHRGDKHLETPMQDVKMSYADYLLCRVTDVHHVTQVQEFVEVQRPGSLQECVAEMRKCIKAAEECYAEEVTVDVEMMLVDGCFILELFYRFYLRVLDYLKSLPKEATNGGDHGGSSNVSKLGASTSDDSDLSTRFLQASSGPNKEKIRPGAHTLVSEAPKRASSSAIRAPTLASQAPEDLASSSAIRAHTLASEAPEAVVLASEAPEVVVLASELPEAVALASEAPEAVALASEAPEAVALASEGPEVVALASSSAIPKPDPIFGSNLTWITVQHDLLLLENQIPFLVLERLFPLTVARICDNISLTDLVDLYFCNMMSPEGEVEKYNHILDNKTTNGKEEEKKYHHILHKVHEYYLPAEKKENNKRSELMRPASELDFAGIKFVGAEGKGKDIFKVTFDEPKKDLFWWCHLASFKIPALGIYDLTEPFLRNLIALEQCVPRVSHHFTSYAFLMDMLVNSEKDIEVLEKAGVLRNYLGGSKDATDLFNNLCKEVVLGEFFFAEICKKATEYSGRFWPKNLAHVKRTYFASPWTFMAFCVGFIVFVISFTSFVLSLL